MLALLVLLAPEGSAPLPAAPPAPGLGRGAQRAERERALAERVEPERAALQVRELCALGARIGGSESNRAAAERLRELFEQAGLEARVVLDPETWCHEQTAWELALVRAGSEGPERVPLASAWPLGFSPGGAGEGPLALEPREGSVWLSPRVRRAEEGAGPALLLVDGATTPDGRYPLVHELGRPGAEQRAVFGLSRAEGELLRAALGSASAGVPPRVAWTLEARTFLGRPRTVEARLAPRAAAQAAGGILFCAHGDSDAGGPGANDNASGVAILLEIASAWQAAIDAGELAPPRREVRFAVWGREIHSSRAYLVRAHALGRLPALVLNYDQAGYGAEDDRLHLEPDDDALVLEALAHFEALLDAHAPAADPPEPAAQLLPARWSTNKGLGGTDAYVFSDDADFRAGGGAALTLFASAWGRAREVRRTEGRRGESWHERELVRVDHDPYYHSAGDTPENTTDREPWNLAWGARTGLLLALRWLDARP